jgi:hypothetical protein
VLYETGISPYRPKEAAVGAFGIVTGKLKLVAEVWATNFIAHIIEAIKKSFFFTNEFF